MLNRNSQIQYNVGCSNEKGNMFLPKSKLINVTYYSRKNNFYAKIKAIKARCLSRTSKNCKIG